MGDETTYRIESAFRITCLLCQVQIKNNARARNAHERGTRHRANRSELARRAAKTAKSKSPYFFCDSIFSATRSPHCRQSLRTFDLAYHSTNVIKHG